MLIRNIIGVDDWLVFARTTDDRLVYTNVEMFPEWFDAPCQGDAPYGTHEWRNDWRFLLNWLRTNTRLVVWRRADTLSVSDDEFAARTAERLGMVNAWFRVTAS